MRPLRHCAWQGVGRVGFERIDGEAGRTDEESRAAQEAASRLRCLGEEAEAAGGMVPDGKPPAALGRFLRGVGVRGSEARDAVATVTVVQCEASNLAELSRAREKAVLELDALGLHLPQLIGGAGAATTACMTHAQSCFTCGQARGRPTS